MHVGNEGYEAKILVDVSLRVRLHHLVSDEEDNFSTTSFCFNSDNDCVYSVDQHNMNDVMDEAVAIIHRDIDDDRDRMNIIGVHNIGFKLIITENESKIIV